MKFSNKNFYIGKQNNLLLSKVWTEVLDQIH